MLDKILFIGYVNDFDFLLAYNGLARRKNMKKISKIIVEHAKLIVILSMILLIPAAFCYMNTRINYDILIYLPENIDTIKGEKILTNDFGLGAYAFIMAENTSSYQLLQLEDDIKNIKEVNQVVSLIDIIDTTIPYDMLPEEITDKLYKDNETIIMVTFHGSMSEDTTLQAIRSIRKIVDDTKISSMSSMVIDTMDLSNQEMIAYVIIAVTLCLIVLLFATDSYLVPVLLLLNIGAAIVYNLGTNLFLGQISYITKAITAILQLGVTTDFSIFLYHKYEQAKKENKNKSKKEAMALAINQTFTSVIGSSLTTFAGFLALCTMSLTLGYDIGIVMAKGVVFGLICVLTLFPALLLVFDNQIEKRKHKNFLPEFKKIQDFVIRHNKICLLIFLILLIPAYIGNQNYEIYYKLDDALPDNLPFKLSNSHLAENFGIISPEIILLDKNVKNSDIEELVEELKNLKGIDLVLAPSTMLEPTIQELLPEEITSMIKNDKYQLMIINSTYEIASDELNEQVEIIDKIVKKYDKKALVAGEGPLMKDLVTIADHDFKMVNYTSIIVIFIIMMLVLKSFGLPIVLTITIEFAIFFNMAISYYTGVKLPFIASIVVGTIQLGATIDYAILMSTKYLEERRTSNKKEAMTNTLKVTVPSIITSALCFFAATVGVVIYSKIDMIASICELLARGAIISMFVVILVLPALLMLCDKFILKTTKLKKEGR